MDTAKLLFGLVLVAVGLVGIGSALTAPFFRSGGLSGSQNSPHYKPTTRDRWFIVAFCIAFTAFGVWLAIGAVR